MKKNITRIVLVMLVAVVSLTLFVACSNKKNDVETGATIEFNVVVPDGAPAFAMAKLFKEGLSVEGYKVNFELVNGTESIVSKLTQKTADMAVMPTNIAAKLYNNNIPLKLVSTNVFGVLYIVSSVDMTSLKDLEGKSIYCIGQGGTPDVVLKNILTEADVDLAKITFEFRADPSEIIKKFVLGEIDYALLAEPAVTNCIAKTASTNHPVSVKFDLQELWNTYHGAAGYPQAGIVATDDALNNKAAVVKAVMKAVKENTVWLAANLTDANTALKSAGSAVSIPNVATMEKCNIRYVGGTESQASLETYLTIMKSFNSVLIGGKLPDANFYKTVSLD